LPDHRERIKVQLLKAEAAFSRSLPDNPARHAAPMQQAFSGIAEVLFKARILTRQILENEIRLLVWDSAIAGGWYRPASDERTDGFPEQLGHYWMWADHSKDWAQLFRAETAEWLAELLDVSGAARARPGVPDPALSPGRIHKADGTCGDTNTPSETKVSPVVNSPVVRRRGFEADATRHDAIANIVGGHDARWKNGSGAWRKDFTLKGICVALDQAEIDVPATWKTGKTQMLKEKQVTITGWRDAFDLGFKKLVTDQIRYSLRMAMKKTPSNLGED